MPARPPWQDLAMTDLQRFGLERAYPHAAIVQRVRGGGRTDIVHVAAVSIGTTKGRVADLTLPP